MTSFDFSSIDRVLLLGPHPDDIEFSSGGTVAKMTEKGVELHYAVFSMCEKSVPTGLPPDIIKKELIQSAKRLNVPDSNLYLYDYKVREFPSMRQPILEDLVALNRKIKPDLVLLPCSSDIHQDHETIHNEGVRAFKHSMLLGYEMPWNNFNFSSHVYVTLEERHIEKKIEVLTVYESQGFRFYRSEDYVRSLATVRGIQIQTRFAEAFEVIRLMIS